MEVKNEEVYQAKPALDKLLKMPWPIKPAYWLAKLSRPINKQYATIDQVRVGLVTKYGTEVNGKISIEPEQWPAFVDELDSLLTGGKDVEEARTKLAETYAAPHGKGQIVIERGTEAWDNFVSDFNTLLAETEDLNIQKVTLPIVEGMEIEPEVFAALDAFVELAE